MRFALLRGLSVAALTLSIAAAGCMSEEPDTGILTGESHSWGGYHWARTSSSFNLAVGNNLDSTWAPYLGTTASDWSTSKALDLTVVAGGSSRRRCRATTGRVEVCNNSYGNNGWLGIASISANGTHITSGTVKLNDTYFNTAQYNTPAWRNLVMCQEVGHTLGLDHQDTDFNNPPLGTCMDYTSDPTPNQHPNQHDYDELATIYAHTDSSTTVSTFAVANGADSIEDWGDLIGSSRGGREETYLRNDGGGRYRITFVTWAE